MKNKLSILFFALFFSIGYIAVSQEKNMLEPNEFFMIHYYTFEGNASQDKLDELERNLSKLEYVSEAKVKYKYEKEMGQVILITKEKLITSERENGFSPPIIKRTIINLGLIPIQYSMEKYSNK